MESGCIGGIKDVIGRPEFLSLLVLGRSSRPFGLLGEEVLARFLPSSWGQTQGFDRLTQWLQGLGLSVHC